MSTKTLSNSKKSWTLDEIHSLIGGELIIRHQTHITGALGLEEASSSDVSFFHNPRYFNAAQESQAGLILIPLSTDPSSPQLIEKNCLLVSHPTRAFQTLIELFYPQVPFAWQKDSKDKTTYLDPTSSIHETAKIHDNVYIGPHCSIGAHVEIESGTKLISNCSIYSDVKIGKNVLIHSQVVIREASTIGNHVIFQPGCVIGSCGYGYTQEEGQHLKLNQVGRVIIEDHVEIGANTTIDRGHFSPTVISKGTKIDNLVQIGHGAKIGQHNLIIGQAGVSGSTQTGEWVTIAGQAGIAGHLKIAPQTTIAAQSGVTKSINKKGVYGGTPASEIRQWHLQHALVKQIPKLKNDIKALQKELDQIKSS